MVYLNNYFNSPKTYHYEENHSTLHGAYLLLLLW